MSVGLVVEKSTGVRGLEITSCQDQVKKGVCSGGREQSLRLTKLSPSVREGSHKEVGFDVCRRSPRRGTGNYRERGVGES